MNNKIKIVATAAISTMMLAGCSVFEPPLMGAPKPAPMEQGGMPMPPPMESKQDAADDFVNIDPPVSSEKSGEEATE